MALALYGKLISKRDFIAIDLPPKFLARWEPWLQGSMSAAMHEFGGAWQQLFFTAPIWRFWTGSVLLGTQALGVMMPSMDGVGRQFPLTLLATPPQGRIFRSLLHDAQTGWFERAEDFLLGTLEEGVSFEATMAALAGLDDPIAAMPPDMPEGTAEIAGSLIAVGNPAGDPAHPLATLQALRLMKQEEALTIWWTIGGENYPPLAFCAEGLPSPALFVQMMRSKMQAPARTEPRAEQAPPAKAPVPAAVAPAVAQPPVQAPLEPQPPEIPVPDIEGESAGIKVDPSKSGEEELIRALAETVQPAVLPAGT